MMNELLSILLESQENQNTMETWFEERTRRHIKFVQDAIKKIVDAYPEFEELIEIGKHHDEGKFKDPERDPYVSLTWRHKMEEEDGEFDPINGKGYQTPGLLDKEDENEATLHHITTHSHHPEYWVEDEADAESARSADASPMPDIAVAEMVADWAAMSEELQKNTVREWYNSIAMTRWNFSDHQHELIDKLIKVFEQWRILGLN